VLDVPLREPFAPTLVVRADEIHRLDPDDRTHLADHTVPLVVGAVHERVEQIKDHEAGHNPKVT